MVGYPYTKQMVSIMDVDMAAAVIVASHEAADRLGVPADRRVYLRSLARTRSTPRYVAEHPDLAPLAGDARRLPIGARRLRASASTRSPTWTCTRASRPRCTSRPTRSASTCGADDRPVTVTGGLPFAGGAASNYLAHALTTMVGVLRDDPGSLGLVSAASACT